MNVLSSGSFLQTSSLIYGSSWIVWNKNRGYLLISSSSSISKVRSEPSFLGFNITGVCSGFQTSSEVSFLRYTGIGSILSGKKAYRRVWVQYRDSAFKNSLLLLPCLTKAFSCFECRPGPRPSKSTETYTSFSAPLTVSGYFALSSAFIFPV